MRDVDEAQPAAAPLLPNVSTYKAAKPIWPAVYTLPPRCRLVAASSAGGGVRQPGDSLAKTLFLLLAVLHVPLAARTRGPRRLI